MIYQDKTLFAFFRNGGSKFYTEEKKLIYQIQFCIFKVSFISNDIYKYFCVYIS